MNPDGTGQMRSITAATPTGRTRSFYARPDARPATRRSSPSSAAITACRAMGELIIFDTGQGPSTRPTASSSGFPGTARRSSRSSPTGSSPTCARDSCIPWPLSEKYFLVGRPARARRAVGHLPGGRLRQHDADQGPGRATRCSSRSRFGPGARPPVIPDRVDLSRKDAIDVPADIYRGPGLKGVPRGTVKSAADLRVPLRLQRHGRAHQRRHRRALGRQADPRHRAGRAGRLGHRSACRPTRPIAIQPLDAKGQALQLMRSWFTAMPGETLSCVGLPRAARPTARRRVDMAAMRASAERDHARGTARRGASASRARSSPCSTRYCVGCHDGSTSQRAGQTSTCPPRPTETSYGLHAVLPGPAPLRPPARARRATITCCAPWSTTRTPASSSRCSARAITTCGSTPRPGTA